MSREILSEISSNMEVQLDSLSSAIGFNRWMFSQYEDYIQWGNIWEIGAGVGNMSEFLLPANFACLSEYDDGYRARLEKKMGHHSNVRVEPVDLNRLDIDHFRKYNFDTIISTNVLEHIENDHKAVRDITNTMKNSTTMITLVPAHPFLYGKLDEKIGHYRRYTKKSLRSLLEKNGQKVLRIKYFNRLSAIGWLLKFKILKKEDISEGDVAKVEKLLPLLKLEKFLPVPFGQSVIAISKKVK
ncbi:MAG: class I SAM-dependent methyltransferase [Oligoflexia bacterium]|nr:class I SAM-dependent methyltransferase [Oligoflexia bacterium]